METVSIESNSTVSTPARPESLPVDYNGIPEEMKSRDTWVCWRFVWKADREEWTKVPVNPSNDRRAKSNDPDTWVAFDTAKAYHENPDTNSDGLGFLFDPEDTIVGIDLDDARNPDTGQPTDTAKDIINTLDSFTEVSPSGTGYHTLVHGALPDDAKNRTGKIEIYERGRYFTVTGQRVDGTPKAVNRRNQSLSDVHAEYVADDDTPTRENDAKGGGSPSNLSDQQLIEKAKNAEYGEEFTRLWNGNTAGYESHSEADYALCRHLLFWTGGDRSRAEELFSSSGLSRDKWDTRPDYRTRTLEAADSNVSDYYDPSKADQQGPAHTTPPEWLTQEAEKGRYLTPGSVVTHAGLNPEGYDTLADAISELDDREKAAVVWELLKQSEAYHVRVHRENGVLYAYEKGVWTPEGERTLRHAAREALGSTNYGKNVLTELETQAKGDSSVEVPSETWGLNPGYVAVKNGLLDLEAAAKGDDALRELRPEDYALTRLPVRYDPDANPEEWRSFVSQVVEAEKVDAFQEYVGYTLHRGDMPINRALLLVGDGANGKSTALNTVRAMLGEENTRSKAIHDFAEPNHIADLHGAIANIHADLSEGALSAKGISKFKGLTGGDTMEGRRLYEESFEFKPTAKHLYAANTTPDVSNYVDAEDSAWWRRWLVIHFPRYFPPDARDPMLERRLTTDESLSGILNWAIQGWNRLITNGRFTNEDTTGATRKRWITWGENVEEFIETCVEHNPDAENLSTRDAYEVYKAWCQANAENPIGQRKFTTTLRDAPVDVAYSTSVRPGGTGQPRNGYKALGFTDDAPAIESVFTGEDAGESDGPKSRNTGLDSFGGDE